MPWGAAIAVGGAIVGGAMQSSSAKKASSAQAQAEHNAIAEQRRQYDQGRADLAPYREAGGAAVTRIGEYLGLGDPRDYAAAQAGIKKPTMEDAANEHLQAHIQRYGSGYTKASDMSAKDFQTKQIFDRMMGEYQQKIAGMPSAEPSENFGALNKKFTVGDFWNDPVTQLSLDYGRKGIERNLGAMGMKKSGLMLKGLQDYAGTRAGESSARFYGDQDRIFNRLSGVAGTGQTATNAGVTAGANYAGNVGQLMTAGGNARGAASIAQGNAWNQGINTIGNWWQQNQNRNQQQQWLDRMYPQDSGGNAGWVNANAPS